MQFVYLYGIMEAETYGGISLIIPCIMQCWKVNFITPPRCERFIANAFASL
jgi:hypothetical protein